MKLSFFQRWFGLSDRTPHRRPKRPNRGLYLRPELRLLEERILLSTIFWTNPSSGFWDVASNWTDDQGMNRVPAAGDDVVINQAGPLTVTIQSGDNIAVNSLTTSAGDALAINGGTLTLAAASTLNGAFTQSGGSWNAGALVSLAGGGSWSGGTIAGPFSGAGNVSLASGELDIGAGGATFDFPAGAFTWSGGAFGGNSGDTLNNTGAITLTGGNFKDFNQGLILDNSGTISDNGTFQWRFFDGSVLTNQSGGTVDMNSTEFIVSSTGGGTINNLAGATFESTGAGGSYTTVPFNSQPGAILAVTNSYFGLAGGGTSTGGIFNVNGAGATLDLTGAEAGTGTDLSGTYTGSGTGNVVFTTGTLQTVGAPLDFDFNQPGYFQWSGGVIRGSQGAVVSNAGDITLTGSGFKDFASALVVDNTGTITDDGTFQWRFFDGSILNNESGGVIDVNSTELILNATNGGTINNLTGALFEDTGSDSYTTVPFNNQAGAFITITSGSFGLSGGGADTGGTFTVDPSATLDLTGGSTPTLTGAYSGSGGGTIALASGTLQIGATDATFNFPAPMFEWSSGVIQGGQGGALDNTGTITLTGGGFKDFANALVVDNSGTITDDGAGQWRFFDGSVLNNELGGTVDMTSTEPVLNATGGGTINNLAGATFESTGAGGSYTTVPFDSQPGAILAVTNSFFGLAGGGTSTGGIFNVNGAGATLDLTGAEAGTVTDLSGTYTGGGTGNVVFTTGTLQTVGAPLDFDFTQPGYFQWSGGLIRGSQGAVVTNAGDITLTGSGFKDFASALVVDNTGTITDNGTFQWRFFDGSILNNESGGVVDMNSAEPVLNATNGGTINNLAGATFESTGAVGSYTTVPFDSQPGAILAVTNSAFGLVGGGTSTGGIFNVNGAGATLDLTGGNGGTTTTLSGSYSGSGTGNVVFTNGTLQAAGNLTFNFALTGYFQWSNGVIRGGAGITVSNSGALTLTGNGFKDMVSALVFDNAGTLTDNGTGQWRFFDGSVFNNQANGVVNLAANEPIVNSSGGGTINNLNGASFENSGTGAAVDVPFDNQPQGIVNVTSGTLALAGGGTDLGGVFTVAPNATLDLTGGSTPILTGSYTGSGGGAIALASGALQIGPAGATFDFPAGLFNWSGGQILGGEGGALTNAGAINLTGSNFKDFAHGLALNNSGTITDSGAYYWRFFDGSILNNQFGGVVNLTTAEQIQNSSGGGSINNLTGATFAISGAGTSTRAPFNNQGGTIAVYSGSFALAGGGTDTGGEFTVGPSATLDLTGGSTPTLTGLYTASGTGTIALSSGTLQIGPAGATFDFPGKLFNWSNGQLSGGTLTNTGDIALTGASGTFKDLVNGVTLDNAGTITDQGGVGANWRFFPGATLNNQPGAVIDLTAAEAPQSAGGGTLNNLAGGLLAATGALALNINITLNNLGAVMVGSGNLTLGSVTQVIGNALTGGTWMAEGAGTLNLPGGSLTSNGGAVTLSGSGSIPQLQALATNTGSFTVENGADFRTAGTLTNSGTLTLGPGGTVTVNGNFVQTAAGTLTEDLGGAPGSGLFGQLTIAGAANRANVNGNFNIAPVNGFAPTIGEAYTAASYPALVGSFAAINGASFAGTQAFHVVVSSTNIAITTTATAGADLAPSSVTLPTAASALVGQSVTVRYTVENLQPLATFASSWTDSVYFSPDGQIDASAVLLGTVQHNGAVAGNGSYLGALTATIPPTLPGNYQVVVQADSGDAVPDVDRLNNTLASTGTIALDLPEIPAGAPTVATIQSGQNLYFRVDPPAGDDVELSATLAVAGEAQIFASSSAIPTPTAFDQLAAPVGSTQLDVPILGASGGAYYILVQGLPGAGAGQTLTFSLRNLGFEIVGVTPTSSPNIYGTVVAVTGSHFTPNTTFSLVTSTATVDPIHTVFVNSNTLQTTFDFNGVAPGPYSAQINDGGQQFTQAFAFQVTPATTRVPQEITTNTEWKAGQVYYLTSNVEVVAGVTLTVDPGAIVKFDPNIGLTIDQGATLLAQGTVAQPIIFTSIKDDAHGGDTNGDGNATSPAAGDWSQIYIAGQANFDHVEVLYGSGVGNTGLSSGAIHNEGGAVTFADSLISAAFYDGIDSVGGAMTITNSVIVGADRGVVSVLGGTSITIVNSTIDDCRIGLFSHSGGALTVENCIVSNSLQTGIQTDGGPLTVTYSDSWTTAAGAQNYSGIADPTGTMGDISADPNYVNPANGDYRLGYLSPAIDAANGNVAPPTDQLGDPRYNDPRTKVKTGVADGNGKYPDMGAFEFEEAGMSTIDLAATGVAGPLAVAAGQAASIAWSEINLGSTSAVGPWHDEIDLVQNPGPNQTVIFAGSVLVAQNATLGPDQTLSLSANVTVPAALPGSYFWQVVPDATGDIYQGANQGIGVGVASAAVALTVPQLAPDGTPLASAFNSAGQTLAFEVIPTTSADVLVSLSDSALSGNVELFASQGSLPAPTDFQVESKQFNSPQPTLLIPSPQAGQPFYIIAYAQSIAGASAPFTLSATTPQFSLTAASPTIIGNSGPVTLEITGGQLAGDDTYQLLSGANTYTATQVQVQDSSTVYATFNLNGAAAGAYSVMITTPSGAPATLSGAVQVVAPIAPTLSVQLLVPTLFRPDRVFSGSVVYENTGNVDMPAPILSVSTGGGAGLSLDGQSFSDTNLMLIGASFSGAAGVLRPGQQFSIPFYVYSSSFNTISFQVTYDLSTDATPVNYSTLATQVGNAGYSASDFNALWANFQQQAGPTWGGIVQVLAHSATYVASVGMPATDFVSEPVVFAFALDASLQNATASATGTLYLNDTNHPLAGATVLLTDAAGDQSSGNVTAPDGSFLIDTLPAGTYSVSVPGYELANPVTVVVPATGAATGLSIVVTDLGAISGAVADSSDNSGVAGITIEATNTTDYTFYSATTDASGNYSLTGLTAGTYDLTASGAAWGTQYLSGVTVSDGVTASGEDFAFAAEAGIMGTVQANGAPAVGAQVVMTDANGDSTGMFTDSTGSYSLTGLAAGAWSLSIQEAGYAAYQATVQLDAGVIVPEPAVNLAAGATLNVKLTDQNSNPLTQGMVELLQNGQAVYVAEADSSGVVSFSELPAGIYTVASEADGFELASQQVTLSAGATQSITLALPPAGTIQGVVQDGNGNPIPNITVTAIGVAADGSELSEQATTNSSGAYQLGDLSYTSYSVTVGNELGILPQDVTLHAGAPQATADFTVPGAVIQGTVVAANGTTPVSGATVFLDQGSQEIAAATTGANGAYIFRLVQAGSYTVSASTPGGLTPVQDVSVASSGSLTANPLVLGNLTLTGIVVGPSGAPVVGANVQILAETAGSATVAFQATTAGDGSFSVTGLPAGPYAAVIAANYLASLIENETLPLAGSTTFKLQTASSLGGTITSAGQPVQATVEIVDPATGNLVAYGAANADGVYSLTNFAAGTYDVFIRAPGYQTLESTGVTAPGTLNFVLTPASTALSGVLTDDHGAPLVGAVVAVYNAAGELVASTSTAQDGSWSINSLAAGTYTVQATLVGYLPVTQTGTQVSSGSPTVVNLALTTASTDDALTPEINLLPFSEALGSFLSNFLSTQNPPATRSQDDYSQSALPAPLCETLIPMWSAVDNLQKLTNQAFNNWVYANRSFNQTTGAGFGTIVSQLTKVAADLAQLVLGNRFQTALSALGNAAETTKDAVGFAARSTANFTVGNYSNLQGITSGLESLSSDVENLYAGTGSYMDNLGLVSSDLLGLLSSGIGLSGNFAGISPLLQPAVALLGDLAQLGVQFRQSYDAFLKASGPVLQAQSIYLSLVARLKAAYLAYLHANHTCPPNPPNPPMPPNQMNGPQKNVPAGQSVDPNDLTTTGVGAQDFVSPSDTITYTIDFENEPTASAAAQQVVVTDALPGPTLLNYATLQLGAIEFNGVTLTPEAGVSDYQGQTVVATDPTHPVDVDVAFNPQTGVLTWTMTSVDPVTGMLSLDPLAGFLPPDNAQHQGEGSVTFTITPAAGLPTTTPIPNQATVVFDNNTLIDTPSVTNTIDSGAPTSSVTVPAYAPSTSFTVSWSGQDDAGGSGIASFNIFVSDNHGPWQLWQDQTAATSAVYTGQAGHVYGFYSVATDNVGNQQLTPAGAQASITVPTFQESQSEAENAAPSAVAISTLLTGHYNDPDGAANTKQGIAVVQLSGNGAWQYSTNGTTWTTIGNVTSTQALLLPASDSVRFTPAVNWDGQANLFFLAWDGSQGTAGATFNASNFGGTTAFSVNAGQLAMTVAPAPLWVGTGAALPPITNANTSPAGTSVATIFGSNFHDDNPAISVGVAIVGATGTSSGTWQYSLDGTHWTTFGSTHTTFGVPSASNALLLTGSDQLRFVPSAGFAGTATLQANAWDGTQGEPAQAGATSGFNVAALLMSVAAQAANNTYSFVDYPQYQNGDHISGSITTDGTIGPLAPANIVSWHFTVTHGSATVMTASSSDPGATVSIPVNGAVVATSNSIQLISSVGNANGTISLYNAAGNQYVIGADYFDGFLDQAETNGFTQFVWLTNAASVGSVGNVIYATRGSAGFSTTTQTATIAVNNAPVLSATTGPTLPTATEGVGGIVTVGTLASDAHVADPDAHALQGIAVVGLGGAGEWPGVWSYSPNGTTWTILPSVSETSAFLLPGTAFLQFAPIIQPDGATTLNPATLTYRAWDQTAGSPGSLFTVSATGGATSISSAEIAASMPVKFVNHAPFWSMAGAKLPAELPGTTPAGSTVAVLFGGGFNDADGNNTGVAIIAATGTSGGNWQFSADGSHWTTFGSAATTFGLPSASNALLLTSSDELRFVPNANFAGTATLQAEAWDGTQGAAAIFGARSGFKITATGGSTAFSVASIPVSCLVNDAPVLGAATGPTLPAITEGIAGTISVSTLIADAHVSDPDAGALQGIAVTTVGGASAWPGVWLYSLTGKTFAALPGVSESSVFLLPSTAFLQFMPAVQVNGAALVAPETLTYRAWDQTAGSAGTQFTVAATGGTTSISSAEAVATLPIDFVNHAPTWVGSGAAFPVGSPGVTPQGSSVASVFGPFFSDMDGNGAGVAIVAATGATGGTWQYSLNGTAWTSFGSTTTTFGIPSASNALLLSGSDQLRFVPHAGFLGTATLQADAWDGTQGTVAATSGFKIGATGGGSAFSAAPTTASCLVNTAPTLAPPAVGITLSPSAETAASAPVMVASLLSQAHFANPDGASAPFGLAVTSAAGPGAWQWSNNGKTWTALPSLSGGAGFLLPSADSLRFLPGNNLPVGAASTQATLTFLGWDETSGSAGTLDALIGPGGGSSAFSLAANPASAKMSVNFVQQSPTWTAGVAASFTPVLGFSMSVNPTPNPAGDTVAAVFGIAFHDAAGAPPAIAISAVTGTADGVWQYQAGGSSTWQAFPTVSTSAALLLTASTKIRFVPNKPFSGAVTLTANAWDGTGSFTTVGGNLIANLTKTGAATPFSPTTLTATCLVNTAPTLA